MKTFIKTYAIIMILLAIACAWITYFRPDIDMISRYMLWIVCTTGIWGGYIMLKMPISEDN